MKFYKHFLVIFLLVFSHSHAFSEGNSYSERYKDIEYYDYDFQVEVDENRIAHVKWNSYLRDSGFKYYKLLYSNSFANPSYPEISAKYVGDNLLDTGNSFSVTSDRYHYFRICTITEEWYGVKGRYCSTPKKITLEEIEYAEKKQYQKLETKKKIDIYQKSNELPSDVKKWIDEKMLIFVSRLQEKHDDDMVVEILEEVQSKLEKYKSEPRYKLIIEYISLVIDDYITDLEDELDILDEIFSQY